jgi:multidrug transporter EmrE-like cation transporter
MDSIIIFWYIVAIINSALAGILAKYYVINNNRLYLYAAIFCNVFLILAYINIFSDNSIGLCYPFIKILAIVIVIATGIVFFNEDYNNYNLLGIFLGLLALILLSIKNENK